MHLPKIIQTQRYGLIKAGSAALAMVVFLTAVYLFGSATCLDSGGRVVRHFYCVVDDNVVAPFPALIHPGLLMAIILSTALLAGLVGWFLWRKQLTSTKP
jgi:hypothetical protein